MATDHEIGPGEVNLSATLPTDAAIDEPAAKEQSAHPEVDMLLGIMGTVGMVLLATGKMVEASGVEMVMDQAVVYLESEGISTPLVDQLIAGRNKSQ